MRRRFGLCAWILLAISTSASGQTTRPEFRPRRLLAPLPVITKFPIQSAAQADKVINPYELVLGVTINGESRAYPINMLTGPRREILNDTLGGRAIAATW